MENKLSCVRAKHAIDMGWGWLVHAQRSGYYTFLGSYAIQLFGGYLNGEFQGCSYLAQSTATLWARKVSEVFKSKFVICFPFIHVLLSWSGTKNGRMDCLPNLLDVQAWQKSLLLDIQICHLYLSIVGCGYYLGFFLWNFFLKEVFKRFFPLGMLATCPK